MSTLNPSTVRGMEIQQHSQRSERCVVMTAYGSADNALASKTGALDYLTRPVDLKQFHTVAASAVQAPQMPKTAAAAPDAARPAIPPDVDQDALDRLVGESEPIQLVKPRIAKEARGVAPVLVRGESGTGKELVARATHACSQRGDGPFVAVTFGAFPEDLLEVEFFGARKGACTGASQDRDGYFQAALGGTLLLNGPHRAVALSDGNELHLDQREREVRVRALAESNFNPTAAAARFGIEPAADPLPYRTAEYCNAEQR